MRFLKKTAVVLSLLVAAAVMAVISPSVSLALALLANPSFETANTTGWTVSNPDKVKVLQNAVQDIGVNYFAKDASYFALVRTGATDTWITVSQTFQAQQNDVIAGWAFFKAGDYQPFDDEGRVLVRQGAGLTGPVIATLFSASVPTVGDYGNGPWTWWKYTFTAGGTYTFEASVRNRLDAENDSWLGVDAVYVDQTPPVVLYTIAPPPNSDNWNNTNVTLTWSATDPECMYSVSDPTLGIMTTNGAASVTLTEETSSTNLTFSATNKVGLTTSRTVEIKIDKTPPTISGSRSPGPNTHGWNNTDVTATFTASDARSGLASVTSPVTVSTQGANQSVTGTATDKAGNVATYTVSGISIDKTKPTLAFGAVTPAPNPAGWNNTDVSIPYTPGDALSGVDPSTPATPLSFTTEGSNLTQTVTVTDKAGNSETFTSPVVKIDKTAPALTFGTPSPVANPAGWNNTDVSVPFTATDALSGVAGTVPAASPVVVSAEGAAVTGTVTATDVAGNSASFSTSAFKIDKTAPTISGSPNPGPNANGWNNTDVTVTFNASDALSGLATPAVDNVVVSTEGAGQSVTRTATDVAGNSASATVSGISIDKTKPTLAFGAKNPLPNAAGWNNTDVSIGYIPSDGLSGVDSSVPASPLSFTTEGSNLTQTVTVTDKAGNSETFTSPVVKIDKMAPTISGSRSPLGNTNGWNNTDVTATFTASDSLSGVSMVTPSTTVTTEGQNQSVTGTAVDVAGNSASATVSGISIDKTKPTLAFGAVTPAPNGMGWNNADVTVAYTPADALSGVDTSVPVSPLSFTTEGSNLTQTVTVSDKAGNSETFTSPVVKIDKTAPTLTFGTPSPAANDAGWNKTDVSVPFAASDALSGVAGTVPAASPVVVSAEGAAVTGTVTATDVAGNSASFSTSAFEIDKTPPTVSGTRLPAANSYGWNSTDVTVTFNASDALSGLATPAVETVVVGTEGAGQSVARTATDVAGNSASATVSGISIDKTKPTLAFGAKNPLANDAGWNKTDVTIPYTPTDTLSGVDSSVPASPLSFTTEGSNLTETVTVTDKAGNSETFTSPVVKIDKMAPTISGSRSPGPNSFGWNNTDVTVTFNASDALSGLATPAVETVGVGTEGAGQSVTGTATDVAGNSASATVSGISIDKTKPTLAFGAVTPAPNAAGWNKTDVTMPYSSADALSGVDSSVPASPLSFTTEGNNLTQTVTVTDKAGNSETFTSPVVKIDKTPPTISGSPNPGPNANGWNNTDVTVTFNASDGLSGVALFTSPVTVSTEGASQSVTGTATDVAGNSASATVSGISIDKTKPTLAFGAVTPAPNGAGWNKTDVTVPYAPADALSGVDTSTPATPLSFTTEGNNLTQTVTVTDKAGNSETFTSPVVKIDKMAPTISGSRSPGPNSFGWNNTDVTVTFNASDALSGLATPAVETVGVGTEGAGQSVTGTATDVAGNSASATVSGISIDKTKPTLAFGAATPAPNPAGWNKTDVTMPYTPGDALSGVDTSVPVSPLSFTTEGNNLTQTVTVTDKAGNSETFTSPVVKIDKTAPTLTFGTPSPAANPAGWNNTDVSVPFAATDALSGVAGTVPAASPVVVSAEGAAVTGTVTATDVAGNSASFNTSAFKIDKTPPTVSGTRLPAANSYGWNSTDVTVTFNASDALSGLATPAVETVVVGTEGAGQSVARTATDVAGNSASATVNSINIDKTPPGISGSRTPAANSYGWNNTSVTVQFTASDNLSGIASVTPNTVLSAEGQNQSVTGTAVNKAGLSSSYTVSGISIDKTKPTVTVNSPQATEYLTGDTIVVSFAATDTLSGVATTAATLDGNPVSNGQSITLSGMAGAHTFVASGTDKAGNTATSTVTFYVVMASTIDIDPDTLNLKSKSDKNAVTAYIELPAGYDVAQIDVSTVTLTVNTKVIAAQLTPTSVGDHDKDNKPDRMVKFDRAAVIQALNGTTGNIVFY